MPGGATTGNTKPLLSFMSSVIIQAPNNTPRRAMMRLKRSRMQLLLRLRFGYSFGPVLGHCDAVLVHLQQLHLFAVGFDPQDEPVSSAFTAPARRWRLLAISVRSSACSVSADLPIAAIIVVMDAMPSL